MHVYNHSIIIAALSFQFTASSPQEAREWVDQINFVLRGKPASLSLSLFFLYFTFSDLLHMTHYGKPLPALFSSFLSALFNDSPFLRQIYIVIYK